MHLPLVSFKDVFVRLGGKEVLHGVTTEVPRHGITALIGLNGSGKTTLLRTLLGETSYKGKIRYHCGHDHSRPSPEHIGYVPQRLRMEANMPLTVKDLFALALHPRPLFLGIPARLVEQMKEMLNQVRAPLALLDQPMDRLSGGEQQRVLLALALHPKPELLLLDEPAAGIDFRDQEKFYDLISNLNRDTKVTILLVSHDLATIQRQAQRVLCLKNGRIEAEGAPEEILSEVRMHGLYGTTKGIRANQL